MTAPHRPAQADSLRRPRPRAALALVLTITTPVLSSCTFHTGKQLEIDYFGSRYRFYAYEEPSFLLHALREDCKRKHGPSREQWGRCSLTRLRDEVDVPALTRVDWNRFTEGGQWADYTDAVANVLRGTIRRDASGEAYVDRCIVGDHAAFGSYNWTYRLTSDSHCKRGSYPG